MNLYKINKRGKEYRFINNPQRFCGLNEYKKTGVHIPPTKTYEECGFFEFETIEEAMAHFKIELVQE